MELARTASPPWRCVCNRLWRVAPVAVDILLNNLVGWALTSGAVRLQSEGARGGR